MLKEVFVIHEKGATRHYDGLAEYCNANGFILRFHEFSPLWQILSALKNRDLNKLFKAFRNILFLCRALVFKDKLLVIGIAPFDWRVFFFNYLSNRNHVFLHTSWPYWDGTSFPVRNLFAVGFLKRRILRQWKLFLEVKCDGLFCVTKAALAQIQNNYNVKAKTSVVNHSVKPDLFFPGIFKKGVPLNFLFIGRIEESKGINIFLELAERFPEFNFIVIGTGTLKQHVLDASSILKNLTYLGQKKNSEVARILRNNDFLILPSIKLERTAWEELFGISIIEAMACGVIPITSDHVGPREIISNNIDGFICADESLKLELHKLLTMLLNVNDETILSLKQNAYQSSKKYRVDVIASKWAIILDSYMGTTI